MTGRACYEQLVTPVNPRTSARSPAQTWLGSGVSGSSYQVHAARRRSKRGIDGLIRSLSHRIAYATPEQRARLRALADSPAAGEK